ncbi:MAG: hypothetical protein PHI34_01630 [Acidobacteriota bacterium]|nr:hypothetical protein [Acidobacteriota bacterium]
MLPPVDPGLAPRPERKGPLRLGGLARALKSPRTALLLLFLLTLGYQVLALTRWRPLYTGLEILFFLDAALLLRLALAAMKRDRLLVFVVLAVLLVRLPFLVMPSGLMGNSDNAVEAIQALQIQDTHIPPPYLLGAVSQHGVFRHLLVAFVWDVLGPGYLSFILVQVLFYLVFLALIYDIGRRFFGRRTVAVLLIAHFAFLEVLFDFSLLLRGGTYLEMLVFALLGMALFDFDLRDRGRIFLSAYFLVFAAGINPFGLFLALPFAGAVLLTRARRSGLWHSLPVLASGALGGGILLAGKKLFYPPPLDTGAWFQIKTLSLGQLRPDRWPELLAPWWRSLRTIFQNVLGFEFRYSRDVSPQFAFRPETASLRNGLTTLHGVLTAVMAVVLAAAIILAVRRLWKAIRAGRGGGPGPSWIEPFFLLLAGCFAGRVLLLIPRPFPEPRHNMDLALLLVWACFFVLDALFKLRPPSRAGATAVVLLLMLLAAPQLSYFHKNARFKAISYARILPVLEARGVTDVATDFTLAHCLYFLSGRTIRASDSIGPVTVRYFLPELSRAVDALPPERKAYLLYTPLHPQTAVMRARTPLIRARIIEDLRKRGILFRIEDLKYYEIVIPLPGH